MTALVDNPLGDLHGMRDGTVVGVACWTALLLKRHRSASLPNDGCFLLRNNLVEECRQPLRCAPGFRLPRDRKIMGARCLACPLSFSEPPLPPPLCLSDHDLSEDE